MYDVKLSEISVTKEKTYLKAKVDELETYSKNKNIRDLHMASVTSKRVTNLEIV
jgi:hypothetical protein